MKGFPWHNQRRAGPHRLGADRGGGAWKVEKKRVRRDAWQSQSKPGGEVNEKLTVLMASMCSKRSWACCSGA